MNKITKTRFPISTIANTVGLHQRTLRIYDEAGILTPERSEKNRRTYSMDDIEKAKLINFMTHEMGLNLNGVKLVFELLPKDLKVEEYETYYTAQKKYLVKLASKIGLSSEEMQQNRVSQGAKGRKAGK